MKKIIAVLFASMLAMAACGTDGASSNVNENATLAPVPAEYAGQTNPVGADAADEIRPDRA